MTDWCYWCPTCGWVEDKPAGPIRLYDMTECRRCGMALANPDRAWGSNRHTADALAMALELAALLDSTLWRDITERINNQHVADWLRACVIAVLWEGQ